jgi:hypothetical protein
LSAATALAVVASLRACWSIAFAAAASPDSFLFELEEVPPVLLVQRPLPLLLAPPFFLHMQHWMPSPPVLLPVTMTTVTRLLLFGRRR